MARKKVNGLNESSKLNVKFWDELEEELEKVNKALPPPGKMDGWTPIDVDEEQGVVLAKKHHTERVVTSVFKAEGIWKDAYDLILRRKQILFAMEFERRLRRYRSIDLKDAKIRPDVTGYTVNVGPIEVAGIYKLHLKEITLLKGHEIEAIDHMMVHHVCNRAFGTLRPAKYRKYVSDDYHEDIKEYVSEYAARDEAEALAECLMMMNENPSITRRIMEANPRLKKFFRQITKNTGYDIAWSGGKIKIDYEPSGKGWDELLDELKKANTSLTPVEKMDDWIPIDIIEAESIVLARKYFPNFIAVGRFKPEGIWEEVYDKMLNRRRILEAMKKDATREDGLTIFVSKELQPVRWRKKTPKGEAGYLY